MIPRIFRFIFKVSPHALPINLTVPIFRVCPVCTLLPVFFHDFGFIESFGFTHAGGGAPLPAARSPARP